MTDVIDFAFTTLDSLWTLIVSSWLLSISVIIVLFGFVIDLVKTSSSDK